LSQHRVEIKGAAIMKEKVFAGFESLTVFGLSSAATLMLLVGLTGGLPGTAPDATRQATRGDALVRLDPIVVKASRDAGWLAVGQNSTADTEHCSKHAAEPHVDKIAYSRDGSQPHRL
jgi:hypothetical protein